MDCEFHDHYSMNSSEWIDIYPQNQAITNLYLEVMPELPLQLSGYVLDRITDGNGIDMATVSLFTGSNEFVENTNTDQTGFFSFSNLKKGPYRLTAYKEGYQTAPFIPIELETNSQIIHNIFLPSLAPPENLIYGRVIDTEKNVLKNVRINVLHNDGKPVVSTLTSRDGTYAVYGLPDGVYKLVFHLTGYACQHYEIKLNSQSRLQDIDITLIPVIPVEASSEAAVCGFITNQQGIPFASAWVGLYKISLQGQETLIASSSTNTDGFYVFHSLPSGKYLVKAKAKVIS